MRNLMHRAAVLAGAVAVVLSSVMGTAAAPGASAAARGPASARASDPPFAYVGNLGTNSVSVIDTATNAVVHSIPGFSRPYRLAVTPDGSHVYVANFNQVTVSGTPTYAVSVIDTSTNTVTDTIPVGGPPRGLAVSPDGRHVYVAISVSPGMVSVIDTTTNTVTDINLGSLGSSPVSVAVADTPVGLRAYTANQGSATVSVIDPANNAVTNLAGPPGGFGGVTDVAVAPSGGRVYATYGGATGSVGVIDTSTNTLVGAPIPVGNTPASVAVAVAPVGGRAYVANRFDNDVSVIDTSTNTVIDTIGVGTGPTSVAVTPDGSRTYVSNFSSSSVSVIDTSTDDVTNVATAPSLGFSTPEGIGIERASVVPVTPVEPDVFAGYADNLRAGASTHPDPWQDSTGVTFEGCNYNSPDRCPTSSKGGILYDAGALRLDNPSTGDMTVTDASVTVGTCDFHPWPALNVAVPAGQSLILTETGGPPPCPGPEGGNYNFDSSEGNLSATKCTVNDMVIPAFHVTVNGDALTYADTQQILNTGGKDPGAKECGDHSETHNWAPMTLTP